MRPLLASFFDGLDGVTYFFVSSGIFILVPAVLFFGLGLWIGALTWGRFKRRFRAGQEMIEDMKNELALLKRRTAELASRPVAQHAVHGRTASKPRWVAAVAPGLQPNPPAFPRSRAFTVWTDPSWNPRPPKTPAPPRETSVSERKEARLELASGLVEMHANAPGRPPAAGGESLTVKSIAGFPKAGANTPTFGDWLRLQTVVQENRASPTPMRWSSPAEAFRAELNAGIARNDYLLGIVFTTPPAQRDDLSKLDGISASECNALRAYGVHNFKQISLWDREHADEFARRLGLRDKSRAAKWIDQAVKLLQDSGGRAS